MNKLFSLVILVIYSVLLTNCSNSPKAPSLEQTSQPQESKSVSKFSDPYAVIDPCKNLKLIGELRVAEFRKLFQCLNKKGGLDTLAPILLDQPVHTETFVKLYNDLFSADADRRTLTLTLIQTLQKNGGLKELLTFVGLFIEAFIDTPQFNGSLKKILEGILTDDARVIHLIKDILNYPEHEELNAVFQSLLDRGILEENLKALGDFLRKDSSQNLVHLLEALFKIDSQVSFNWEDIYQLSYHGLPKQWLFALYQLQMEDQIPQLLHLTQDLLGRNTATILTQDRLEKLKDPQALSPDQREASLQVLRSHPDNDLAAFVKLISSFNRGFVEDEDISLNRNLLHSLDTFLQGVKTAFDADQTLGPDADATRIITTYILYLNLSYLELMYPEFHCLTQEEKGVQYTSMDVASYPIPYPKFISDYQIQKTREVLAKYQETLEKERDPQNPDKPKYTPIEIRRMVKTREREFKANELPNLLLEYHGFLNSQIQKALIFINERPLFLNFTWYDVLLKLKDEKNISLLAQKFLLNLDIDLINKFTDEVIHGLLKDFFDGNRPIENFMRSLDTEHSGATWLSHTVSPLIHGFGKSMPMKDQISIIAMIESFQAIERLLITENRFSDLKSVLLPLLKCIWATGQDERVLKMVQLLHSGQFTNDHYESQELITQLSPILRSMIESHFLENSINFMAFIGKNPESVNRFLNFLTLSDPKKHFLDSVRRMIQPDDNLFLEEKIIYLTHTLDHESKLSLLHSNLLQLSSPDKQALMSLATPALFAQDAIRPITPLIQTLKNLSSQHPDSLALFLNQLGTFLTPSTVHLLMSCIQKYQQTTPSQESFLTRMIKQDQIQPLLNIVLDMIEDNSFQPSHAFVNRLIQNGELEKSIDLLVKLLLIQGGNT